VFVHGLSSKPPATELLGQWKRTLLANIRADDSDLATAMNGNEELFRMAYWADAVPDHVEDPPVTFARARKAVDRVIGARRRAGGNLHIGSAGWRAAEVKRFGPGIVDALATSLSVKPAVVENHMREVRLYHRDQYIADRIREPLERELRDAWDAGRSVVLVTHSMGSVIAYDVLWRFSHRSEPRYRSYRRRRVDLLVTLGSPLGDAKLRGFMLIDRWKDASRVGTKTERRRYFPTNIGALHNYSAYGDLVCHGATLTGDFFGGLRDVVGGYAANDLRDYVKLYNPYVDPAGYRNPHKSYGYLIQPKLSQKLRQFFGAA
jgi:hypothetical protein